MKYSDFKDVPKGTKLKIKYQFQYVVFERRIRTGNIKRLVVSHVGLDGVRAESLLTPGSVASLVDPPPVVAAPEKKREIKDLEVFNKKVVGTTVCGFAAIYRDKEKFYPNAPCHMELNYKGHGVEFIVLDNSRQIKRASGFDKEKQDAYYHLLNNLLNNSPFGAPIVNKTIEDLKNAPAFYIETKEFSGNAIFGAVAAARMPYEHHQYLPFYKKFIDAGVHWFVAYCASFTVREDSRPGCYSLTPNGGWHNIVANDLNSFQGLAKFLKHGWFKNNEPYIETGNYGGSIHFLEQEDLPGHVAIYNYLLGKCEVRNGHWGAKHHFIQEQKLIEILLEESKAFYA